MARSKYAEFYPFWIHRYVTENLPPRQIAEECASSAHHNTIRLAIIRAGVWSFSDRELPTRPIAERLNANLDKNPGHGPGGDCWIFTGCTKSAGYGMMSMPGETRPVHAHHVAYELHHGVMLMTEMKRRGVCILHTCDQPACCNPQHLRLGSFLDNARDRDRKRRGATILTPRDAWEMRVLKQNDPGVAYAELGRRYGVSLDAARCAVLGLSFADVPFPHDDASEHPEFTHDGYLVERFARLAA